MSTSTADEECLPGRYSHSKLDHNVETGCIVDNSGSKQCIENKNFGVINITCNEILHIHMEKTYSHSVMLSTLGNLDDEDTLNQPMIIKLKISDIDSEHFNQTLIEEEIDLFLTQRPWWRIQHEHEQIHHNSFIVIFERYPKSWRPHLKFLVQTQYMSDSNCKKTPLIAGRESGLIC